MMDECEYEKELETVFAAVTKAVNKTYAALLISHNNGGQINDPEWHKIDLDTSPDQHKNHFVENALNPIFRALDMGSERIAPYFDVLVPRLKEFARDGRLAEEGSVSTHLKIVALVALDKEMPLEELGASKETLRFIEEARQKLNLNAKQTSYCDMVTRPDQTRGMQRM